ncbi:MAG: asparagine synthase-related protein [Candidatus Alcyoniella australis]|nr:asparagine synthase-related protein [Candidatus Alcyoniella australis]
MGIEAIHGELDLEGAQEARFRPSSGCVELSQSGLSGLFHGELYNRDELIQGLGTCPKDIIDSELVLRLYERWGDECLAMLDGRFSMALWDTPQRRLLLARDRFGQATLYWHQCGASLAFASQLDALTSSPGFAPQLDRAGLNEYLSQGYVCPPRTMFQGVHALKPGQALNFDQGGVREFDYWSLPDQLEPAASEDQLVEQMRELLARAAKRRFSRHQRPVMLLSGGIDSALLACLAAENNGRVSAYHAGFGDLAFDNRCWASELMRWGLVDLHGISLQHDALRMLPELVRHDHELCANPSSLPILALAREIGQGTTVDTIFTGTGMDELMAGCETIRADLFAHYYGRFAPKQLQRMLAARAEALSDTAWPVGWRFRIKLLLRGAQYGPSRAHIFWRESLGDQRKAELLTDPTLAETGEPHGQYAALLANVAGPANFNRIANADLRILSPCWNQQMFRPGLRAAGLSPCHPYLDNELARFCIELPFRYKLRGLRSKYLLKRAASRWLPRRLVNQRKRGLSVPVGEWIRCDRHELVERYLGPERMCKLGLFDPRAVSELREQHRRGGEDHTFSIWTLLVFSAWHEAHLEAKPST